MDISTCKELSIEAARKAGSLLAEHHTHVVLSSIGKDMKTAADKEAHALVVELLRSGSGIPVLSEEDDTHDFSQELVWMVDPLDGSVNYVREIPLCAVSIALMRSGQPVIGVVYDFNREELFVCTVDEAATLNGKAIKVSQTGERKEGIIMTGFPSYTGYDDASIRKYVSNVQTFKKIRNIGSAALSLAYVACGRADAYYEKDIKIWDVAAGIALVRSAGGAVQPFSMNADGRCEIMASNGRMIVS